MSILYELPALKLPYSDVKYYWATSHYDIDWSGYVKYNNRMWKARTIDETDNVFVYLTPMRFTEKIKMYYDKFVWEYVERPLLFWKNRKRLK